MRRKRSPFTAASYITRQFTTFCKNHLRNPTTPFDLYTGFLESAKANGSYGWMKLAKEHRQDLLRQAYNLLIGVYGRDVIKQKMDRQRGQA